MVLKHEDPFGTPTRWRLWSAVFSPVRVCAPLMTLLACAPKTIATSRSSASKACGRQEFGFRAPRVSVAERSRRHSKEAMPRRRPGGPGVANRPCGRRRRQTRRGRSLRRRRGRTPARLVLQAVAQRRGFGGSLGDAFGGEVLVGFFPQLAADLGGHEGGGLPRVSQRGVGCPRTFDFRGSMAGAMADGG